MTAEPREPAADPREPAAEPREPSGPSQRPSRTTRITLIGHALAGILSGTFRALMTRLLGD
ncbi:hypothetical protein ACFXAZ_06190 [Streptomyces sp. NPDC059477]|uniref:hypothetical protein n=1 Tax=Streptomyces sp. NPDC059477 TaxID=3346847 RepID=UPI003695DD78